MLISRIRIAACIEEYCGAFEAVGPACAVQRRESTTVTNVNVGSPGILRKKFYAICIPIFG